MRTIKAEKISIEGFAPFGSYCEMMNPSGLPLCGEFHKFYPDRVTGTMVGTMAFSPIVVKKNEMEIKQVEYHTSTWEGIMPINDDMIIHVSPASGNYPVVDETKAFIVPKGTMVKINAAIWHLAPLPANEEYLNAMIILPECTYARDCPVIDLKEEDCFKIEL